MHLARFQAIVDAYGTDSKRWPAAERDAAAALLASDPAAQQYLAASTSLDRLLDSDVPEPVTYNRLKQSILDHTTRRPGIIEQVLDWLMPSRGAIWRPVAVACLPLVLGIGIGLNLEVQIYSDTFYADTWEDELEVLGLDSIAMEANYE